MHILVAASTHLLDAFMHSLDAVFMHILDVVFMHIRRVADLISYLGSRNMCTSTPLCTSLCTFTSEGPMFLFCSEGLVCRCWSASCSEFSVVFVRDFVQCCMQLRSVGSLLGL